MINASACQRLTSLDLLVTGIMPPIVPELAISTLQQSTEFRAHLAGYFGPQEPLLLIFNTLGFRKHGMAWGYYAHGASVGGSILTVIFHVCSQYPPKRRLKRGERRQELEKAQCCVRCNMVSSATA